MVGLLLSILLVTAGELAPPPGMCTCTAQDKALDAAIAEQVKAADFIFEGVVLEVHDYPSAEARRLMADSSRVRFGFGRRRYAFFVASKTWKGPHKRDVVVSTLRSESMCGYPFEDGKRYLVYASAGEWGPTTTLCTRTRPVAEAAADKQRFGELFEEIPRGFDAAPGAVFRTARQLADAQGYAPRAYAADLLLQIGGTPFVLELSQQGEQTAAHLRCRVAQLPDEIREKAEAFMDEVSTRVAVD